MMVIENTNQSTKNCVNYLDGKYLACIKHIPPLSTREKDCLYWSARGKRADEIAIILNIRKRSVLTYTARAKNKLNSVSIAQAVYVAVKLGIL
jgi:DNA-binding CsgD family transcriptional regulator